ncbi:hypothetical protein AB7849_15610 [Rhodanobacter sp. 115]|uniref:hypothetical protein n=1 Tax=Rhodanobacter sp. FW021-MT20 TaxID=1162282 RepID=UPI0034E4D592
MSQEREIERCRFKLGLCLRNARESSRDSWQHAEGRAQRREYRRMSRESLQTARYWIGKLRRLGIRPEPLFYPERA